MPYIGVYLADLTFVEGRPPLTSASSATLVEGINFSRMRMLKQVITELLHWQQFPYKFEPIPELIHYLNSEPPDQIPRVYQLSLELEPHT